MSPLLLGHDYLIQMGGAERVVASMLRRYPEAPLYTSAVKRDTLLPEFRSAGLRVSWMQRLPGIETRFKHYFALYPSAFHRFGVLDAETAWVSASSFAKCLRFTPRTATVLYCHAPTRFLWQTDTYVGTEISSPFRQRIVRATLPHLRKIDRTAARRFDHIVANSESIRRRIQSCYQREATVIHPPVDLSRFRLSEDFSPENPDRASAPYLVLARLVAYKGIDRAVTACTSLGRRLVVVGEGPDRPRLERLAGPTVQFLGRVSDAQVDQLLASSRALLFPGEEDFGIAPVEAQACGMPVVALGRGGALETVIDGETGCFFSEPTADSLAAAVLRAEEIVWDAVRIRRNAERFSEAEFHRRTAALLEEAREQKRVLDAA